jgi:Transposase IS4/DDE_Tnp_1-like zinc-ribbon
VQVVERLVEPFRGTHRTIYVNRFYTSLELLKSLTERQLYVTGTMLATRIPQAIRMTKTSAEYKNMKRGDAVKFKLSYGVDGKPFDSGLVAWRDRNVVYCLSNDSNNFEFDECKRRGDKGILSIPRPISIANYNRYMGGVDLADMRRLQCNSTIMGQNRWWLKLFFYLLDVGTSNALVLYNEFRRMKLKGDEGSKPMNIVDFKKQLVADFIGKDKMDELKGQGSAKGEGMEHVPVRVEGNTRYRCALCTMEEKDKRTRFMCALCGVPFCSMGNGRVKTDCFTIAHKSEDILKCAKARHVAQQKFYNREKL